MNITATTTGIRDAAHWLRGQSRAGGRAAVRKALRNAGHFVAGEIERRIPRVTGEFAAETQIKVRAGKRSRNEVSILVIVSGKKEGWPGSYIELGFFTEPSKTGERTHVPPQPFVRPAGYDNEAVIEAQLGRDIVEHITSQTSTAAADVDE